MSINELVIDKLSSIFNGQLTREQIARSDIMTIITYMNIARNAGRYVPHLDGTPDFDLATDAYPIQDSTGRVVMYISRENFPEIYDLFTGIGMEEEHQLPITFQNFIVFKILGEYLVVSNLFNESMITFNENATFNRQK